jgi:hypothetical protein
MHVCSSDRIVEIMAAINKYAWGDKLKEVHSSGDSISELPNHSLNHLTNIMPQLCCV